MYIYSMYTSKKHTCIYFMYPSKKQASEKYTCTYLYAPRKHTCIYFMYIFKKLVLWKIHVHRYMFYVYFQETFRRGILERYAWPGTVAGTKDLGPKTWGQRHGTRLTSVDQNKTYHFCRSGRYGEVSPFRSLALTPICMYIKSEQCRLYCAN